VQPRSGIWIIFKVYTLITPRVERNSRPTSGSGRGYTPAWHKVCLSEEALTSVRDTHSRGPFETIRTRGR